MGIVIAPESELGKELARWEAPKREGGMNRDGHEEYPRMLYKAHRLPNGKAAVGHPLAGSGDKDAEAFAARCWRTVGNGDEHERAEREGWSDSPLAALDAFEKEARAEADAAANAAYQVKRMSQKAQEEFDAAQEAAEFHDPEVKAPKLPPRPRDDKGRLLPKTPPTEG